MFAHASRSDCRRGSTIMLVVVSVAVLGALVLTFLTMTRSSEREVREARHRSALFYTAEGGLNEALAILRTGGREALDAFPYPQDFGGATYTVRATYGTDDGELDDDVIKLLAHAEEGGQRTTIEMLLRKRGDHDKPEGAGIDAEVVSWHEQVPRMLSASTSPASGRSRD